MRTQLLRAARLFPGLAKLRVKDQFLKERQLAQLLAAPVLAEPGWLPHVTDLELQVSYAVSHLLLVPQCVADACPNLTHLQHVWSGITELRHRVGPVRMAKLQQLTLVNCELHLPADALKQQLQALPGLQHLASTTTNSQHDYSPYMAAITEAVSQQLASLELDVGDDWPAAATGALLSQPWPLLQKLHLRDVTIADAEMELMLQQLPQLQHLDVDAFKLQTDFHERQCRWQEVVVSSVHVASVARLPLSTITALCLSRQCNVHLADTGSAAGDLQLTAAAAAAAAACGGLQPLGRGPAYLVSDAPHHTGQLLLATLPLLQHMPGLALEGAHITRQLLSAISSHMPACTRLYLGYGAGNSFEVGIWGSLVSLLPRVTHLDIHNSGADVGLQQLTVLCATATHAITFWTDIAELREQLRSVVRDAGHGLVTVL